MRTTALKMLEEFSSKILIERIRITSPRKGFINMIIFTTAASRRSLEVCRGPKAYENARNNLHCHIRKTAHETRVMDLGQLPRGPSYKL